MWLTYYPLLPFAREFIFQKINVRQVLVHFIFEDRL